MSAPALPPVEMERGDCEALEHFLTERIYEYNSRTTGYFDGESFGATQKDEAGAIIAGIAGYTWGGCCYVSHLWVTETMRGNGVGRALLEAAEANAISKGCSVALLSSHSFQSPGFYERMGYEEQAVVNDHPVGYSNTYYAKRLVASAA